MIVENLFHGTEESEFVPKTVVHMDGSVSKSECRIVSEHGMKLFLNEKLTMKLICTPSNLTERIIGRLISERYTNSTDEIEMIYICSRLRCSCKTRTEENRRFSCIQTPYGNQNGVLHLRINLFPIQKYTEQPRGHTAAISA